jgi:hypothetical protein
LLALALIGALMSPVSAFFWNKKEDGPKVSDFSKNGMVGSIISFDQKDFAVKTNNKASLNSIRIDTLPDPAAGTLVIGGQPVEAGAVVDSTALSGLRFQCSPNPAVTTTKFTFTPSFSSGQDAQGCTVSIYLLTKSNEPPIARNMDLSTYQNIAITGYFDAVDSESDLLTFQLTSTPTRGAVTMAEDGSSQFVYTPYENKTGNDSFTFVATDIAGNTSPEAKVSVRIDKPSTKVTYADLDGNSAHKAAIRLAEEKIYLGQCVNGSYFFEPEQPVSRAQFLSMAMAITGLEPMEDVTLTGFADDDAIPTWAKGTISAALKAGAVRGCQDETGAPIFSAQRTITRAEATVMLNNLLGVTDVPVEVFSFDSAGHWAAQAAANLAASGVLRTENANAVALGDNITRAEAAEMLDGALDVLAARKGGGWLPW